MKRNLKIFLMGWLFFQLTPQTYAQNWDWVASDGGSGSDYAYGTATDPNDNIIQVGAFLNQNMQVGSFTLTNQGSADCFISKYDATGAVIWSRGYGTSGFDQFRRVLTDDQGNIYAVGDFNGPFINFGNGVTLTSPGGTDAFIIKLDPGGNPLWARSLAGVGTERASDLVITPCGVLWGGHYNSSTASILGGTISNADPTGGSQDVFMCCLFPDGTLNWVETYGSPGDEGLKGLANRGKRIYAVGYFTTTITLGNTTHTSLSNNTDAWIANFKCQDPNSFIWSTSVGGTGYDNMTDIAVGYNQIFITGNTYSNSFLLPGFGSTQIVTGGQLKAVLFSYSASGNPLWFRHGENLNAPYGDYAQAVEVDQCGHVYATGRYSSFGVNWSGTTLPNTTPFQNFYLVRYKVNGILDAAIHLPGIGGGGLEGEDIAFNSENEAIIAGTLKKGVTASGTNYYTPSYPSSISDVALLQMDNSLDMQLQPAGPICENAGTVALEVFPSHGTGTWTCPTAPNALTNLNNTTTNSHTNGFAPALAGPGIHCVTFTLEYNLCSYSVTECIEVLPAPNIVTSPIPPICSQGGLVDLSAYVSPTGGVFTGPGISGNFFDPTDPNVSSGNVIFYAVTDPTTNCTDNSAFLVTVTDDRWHQSSSPTGFGDSAFDLVTDDEGNSYVTGSFSLSTILSDHFGNSISLNTSGYAMFVAKYSPCGVLLWANHSSGGWVNGYGVAVDESTDMVYVTGNYNGASQFEDYCGNNTATINGTGGYVSQFDRNTGCHLFTNVVPVGIESAPQACVAWDGHLYLTGQEDAAVGSPEFILFTSKYTPDASSGTANQLGNPDWHTPSAFFAPSPRHISRDIELDLSQSGAEQVVITGDFTKSLRYIGSNLGAYSFSERDAFYTIFDEASGTPQVIEQFGADPAPAYATGSGVAVNPSGKVFLTGTFKTSGPASPFAVPAPLIGGTEERAYVVEADASGWSRELFAAGSGRAQGRAIEASDDAVVVAGNFLNGTLNFGNLFLPYISSQGAFKIYTGTFDLSGNAVGINGSTSPGSANSHMASAVGLGLNDTYFTTGYYIGQMNFLVDNSYTGPLPTQTAYSMFLLRSDLDSQGYFKGSTAQDASLESSIEIWPNPSLGRFTLKAGYEDAHIEVYNLTGQRILVQDGQNLTSGLELDLSGSVKGTYLIRITDQQGNSHSERIIIQ